MAIIHVRAMIDFTIDTQAYAAARQLEDIGDEGLTADDHDTIAQDFLTLEYEALVPRFAWHCIELTNEHIMIADAPFPSLFTEPESDSHQ
jgi:hypothetical protein